MSPEEIAFKEQISQRFMPFGYGMPVVSDLWRLHEIDSGEQKYTKEYLSRSAADHVESAVDNIIASKLAPELGADRRVVEQARADMFRQYLGLEQYFNTLRPAKYKPGQSKEPNAKYFQFDEQKILDGIAIRNPELKKGGFDFLVDYVNGHNRLPGNGLTFQLGAYKAYVAFDAEKNEHYISYYDKWDMNPPQLDALGINVDQFNFPPEIYGRIYKSDYDKFAQTNDTEQKL